MTACVLRHDYVEKFGVAGDEAADGRVVHAGAVVIQPAFFIFTAASITIKLLQAAIFKCCIISPNLVCRFTPGGVVVAGLHHAGCVHDFTCAAERVRQVDVQAGASDQQHLFVDTQTVRRQHLVAVSYTHLTLPTIYSV